MACNTDQQRVVAGRVPRVQIGSSTGRYLYCAILEFGGINSFLLIIQNPVASTGSASELQPVK